MSDTDRKGLLDMGAARKPASTSGRYLLYALGEIVLVVIGILIALQINNWNESKKRIVKGQEILHEIRENLEFNNRHFKQEINEELAVMNSIDLVLENLNEDKGYHDSLDFHFLNVAYWPASIQKSSGYEAMKFEGVEIIRSKELRKTIIDLYEEIYDEIGEIARLSEANSASTIWPYFTELFETQPTVPNQPFETIRVTPFDYEEVKKSKKYRGIISWWRHSRVVAVQLRMNAIEENKAILELIENELKD